MATILSVPAEYGYVLASIMASTFVNQYHGTLVGLERKSANIPYPNAYASHSEATSDIKKYRFNCAQRAHQNFLEHFPTFITASAIAGLKYPVATAVMGAVWNVGRIVFAKGYINSTQEQKGAGRYKGAWYLLAELGLLGTACYTVYQMVM
ncbi:ER glutathione S transferase [Pyronema omphalodes]|nr:ER glutathione S transferase [Pyronema omphalodes]